MSYTQSQIVDILKSKNFDLALITRSTQGVIYDIIKDGVPVAIEKRAIKTEDGNARDLHNLDKEYKLISNLHKKNVPGIVTVYGKKVSDDKKTLSVYMERGIMDLETYMRKTLNKDKVHTIFTQLVTAIHACHVNNVYHRDLKPSNIIITSEEPCVIKLIDFGAAETYPDANMCTGMVGTLPYMYKQVRDTEIYNCSEADLYSIGIILHSLLVHSDYKDADNKLIYELISKLTSRKDAPTYDLIYQNDWFKEKEDHASKAGKKKKSMRKRRHCKKCKNKSVKKRLF